MTAEKIIRVEPQALKKGLKVGLLASLSALVFVCLPYLTGILPGDNQEYPTYIWGIVLGAFIVVVTLGLGFGTWALRKRCLSLTSGDVLESRGVGYVYRLPLYQEPVRIWAVRRRNLLGIFTDWWIIRNSRNAGLSLLAVHFGDLPLKLTNDLGLGTRVVVGDTETETYGKAARRAQKIVFAFVVLTALTCGLLIYVDLDTATGRLLSPIAPLLGFAAAYLWLYYKKKRFDRYNSQ